MPGQATVTINEDQWNVWVANTPTELTTGLSGVESIPAGTGMLFLLPAKQPVTVDTSGMLFPIDIIFISENLVIEVASNIQSGYLVTEETPSDMFLEVNAGEAAGVEVGDAVTAVLIQQPGFDLRQIMAFAIPLAALGFVCALAGGMVGLMGGSSSPREHIEREHKGEKLLPETKSEGKFEAGEIVNFKGERVRVLEHIGDRVSIWVPSRQEEAWIKPEALERIAEAEARPEHHSNSSQKVIPTEKRPRREGDLEYLADSPEFLTQTIEAIGYRDKLDTAFQTAIARAKGVR